MYGSKGATVCWGTKSGQSYFASVSIMLICLALEGVLCLGSKKALCDVIEMFFLFFEISY